MHRWILIAALLGFASQAQAADVYRCVAPDGAVSYRDTSCPVGYLHARTYRAVEDPAGDAQVAKRDAQYLDMGRSWLAMQDAAVSTTERDERRARCNAAKGERERILRTVGLDRDFELLRDLDETVYDACRGL
jgi:hypothetical protein